VITLEELRAELAAAGEPTRAKQQQRYMKSSMPYHGLTLPELRAHLRPHLRQFAPADAEVWRETVRSWWDAARYREEWYAAIALARHRSAKSWHDLAALDLYRHMIVTGAWWDVVDDIAQHLVAEVLAGHRDEATRAMRSWAVDENLWLRRTAVLCQTPFGDATDLDLLTFAIERNLDDPSFWLRKAIGWALRQHARSDPEWVRAYVDGLGDRLSGLSRREATKHL
jgi:3-methyladenine DNA glycosylase AlkD